MTMATDPSISAILDDLGELLPLIAVDVGARNGPIELAGLKDLTAVYGFEPSAREFEKLSSKTEEILREKPQRGTQRTFPRRVGGHRRRRQAQHFGAARCDEHAVAEP